MGGNDLIGFLYDSFCVSSIMYFSQRLSDAHGLPVIHITFSDDIHDILRGIKLAMLIFTRRTPSVCLRNDPKLPDS